MEAANKDEGPFPKTQDNVSGSSNLPLTGLKSDRFFIELNESSSILTGAEIRNKDCSVLPVDSMVPYSGVLEPLEQSKSSERLFFEPSESSSILAAAILPYKDCLAVTVGSADPCADFRVAMELMVEGYGLEDSERLEELMVWYLRMNMERNHGHIIGAFVELYVNFLVSFLPHSYSFSSTVSDYLLNQAGFAGREEDSICSL
ncbi:hypothetical protein RJ639_016661 [Escallonia herrerae]|uniref:Transcription repressor n=1 Tax=Escallonia herrerae TaxID=1293975 RepID=A0AA88VEX2_9ASTE|nr:hypothetical protein RJ639_016661 [Escallonia herrerae]